MKLFKKKETDVDKLLLIQEKQHQVAMTSLKTTQEIYKRIIDDQETQIEKLNKRNDELFGACVVFEKRIKILTNQIIENGGKVNE